MPIDTFPRKCLNYLNSLNQKKGAPMRRKKMSRKKSNKNFKKGMGTNRKNIAPAPTRGGYRL